MSDWRNTSTLQPRTYVCGYCGTKVTSNIGYEINSHPAVRVYICPCERPTYFDVIGSQYPAPSFGEAIKDCPDNDVIKLYDEARRCTTAQSYTAAVLVCRKILMHIAVEKGAPEGKSFLEYVGYLSDHHYVPPDGKEWVGLR